MIPGPDSTGRPYEKKKKKPRTGSSETAAERRMRRSNEKLHAGQVAQTNANSRAQRTGSPPLAGDTERTRAAQTRAERTTNQQALQKRKAAAEVARRNRAANADDKKKPDAKAPVGNSNRRGNGPGKGHGHTKGGGKGKPGKSQGTPGGSKTAPLANAPVTDYKGKAASAVDLMLNPKINALQRQGDTIASEYTNQRNNLDTQTGRQLSDLSTTYKQLDNTLAALGQDQQNQYGQAANTQNAQFDQLLASLQGNAEQNAGAVNSEFARLGLGADTSQQVADAQYQQGLAQQNKAMAASQLAQQQANYGSYNSASRGNYAAQGAQFQSQAKSAATDMLNDLLFQRNTKVRDLNSQIGDVKGQRGSLMNQLMQEYEQQAYERKMEAQQQGFMNQMNVNEFNLDQDQFNADQAYRQAQLALAGQTEARLASEASAPENVKNGGFGEGFTGAQGYLQKNMTDPKRRAALTSILQRIDTHRQRGKGMHDFNQSSPADTGKILNFAYSFLDDPGFRQFNGPRSRSLLSQAMNAYFGRL